MSDAPDRLLLLLQRTIRLELGPYEADLTFRQLGILLVVYQTQELQTVRGLAAMLLISQPIVSKALTRLGTADLIRRKIDPTDRRSVQVMRTLAGTAMMQRLADAMATASSD